MEPRPGVIVFDVNETLSDMAPMASRFADVGAPGLLARVWFSTLLRHRMDRQAARALPRLFRCPRPSGTGPGHPRQADSFLALVQCWRRGIERMTASIWYGSSAGSGSGVGPSRAGRSASVISARYRRQSSGLTGSA